MTKNSIYKHLVYASVLTTLLILLDVLNSRVELDAINAIPYLFSVLLGASIALVYSKFMGEKFKEFQLLVDFTVFVLLAGLVIKSDLNDVWLIHDFALCFSFAMTRQYSRESQRHATQQGTD